MCVHTMCRSTNIWQHRHTCSLTHMLVLAPSCDSLGMPIHIHVMSQCHYIVVWAHLFTHMLWPGTIVCDMATPVPIYSVSQHQHLPAHIYLFPQVPCPSAYTLWHEQGSQHCHVGLHVCLLPHMSCPSTTMWQHGNICSHTYHVPMLTCGGMGTCHTWQWCTWQCGHMCSHTCMIPVWPHGDTGCISYSVMTHSSMGKPASMHAISQCGGMDTHVHMHTRSWTLMWWCEHTCSHMCHVPVLSWAVLGMPVHKVPCPRIIPWQQG